MAHSSKRIDQARHHGAWEELAREAVDAEIGAVSDRMLRDDDFFWRKVDASCKDDFGRDYIKARAKIVNLIGIERARARMGHWGYSIARLIALHELNVAVNKRIERERFR